MSAPNFTPRVARPLPVLVLADASASMGEHGKRESQDVSIREMLDAFRMDAVTCGAIDIAVITFSGTEAKLEMPLTPVADAQWPGVARAAGRTPLGAALALARDVIEGQLPINSLAPVIILTSDGRPNADDWRAELAALLAARLGAPSQRIAIAIGADVDRDVLTEFAGDEGRVLDAADGADVIEFFRRITAKVTQALTHGTYSKGLPPFTG